jgi:predicted dehydrogenase/nucleoside-diphosphate-sugar epimerase
MSRVCLIGAGVIAQVHAQALQSLPGARIVAVADPNIEAARRLARSVGAQQAVASVAELPADSFERAHVLVPPDRHAEVAQPLLEAGIAVLLEKPLATSAAECESLIAAAAQSGAPLGVNQNFVHHPAFARLRRIVEARALGPPSSVQCTYAMPLRQLQAQAFGHWMFATPGNLLLEQAVHPLSQLLALIGPVREVRALGAPPVEIAPGVAFCRAADIVLHGEQMAAQLRFAVGQSFPVWQVSVVCEDGTITADIANNRLWCQTRGRWLEAADALFSGLRTAGAIARDAIGNAAAYALSTARLRGRSDPFYLAMRASIAAFHAAVDAGRAPALDGAFGARLVALCEAIRDQAFPPAPPRPAASHPREDFAADIAILGGTGFIGRHLVRRALDAGLRVAVMARSLRNLPEIFADARVALSRGSISDPEALARAIGAAPVVVNLAHGGGGASFEEIRAAMVGGAEAVARACLAGGVRRLLHVGSIASLYLGPQAAPVTGATPPDPHPERRGDYARAKALCDALLLRLHAEQGLPVVILRPGIVVGEGGPPFHTGLGFYNNEQHCIGWNAGRNPLPFVLVEDVADAVLRAAQVPGIEGRCYNLVGDVRPDARSFVADLARALQRPLRYHPQSPTWLWLEDCGKWLIKRAAGRQGPAPSRRDFLSRGLCARFDCSDAKRDLGWRPEADPARFHARAILVHAG